jgi:hypothetical protein
MSGPKTMARLDVVPWSMASTWRAPPFPVFAAAMRFLPDRPFRPFFHPNARLPFFAG